MSQRLFTATTDTNEHGIASRLHQDSHDSTYVRHGVIKEDKIHLARRRHIVISELLVKTPQKFLPAVNELILLRLRVKRQNIREDDLFVLTEGLFRLAPLDFELHGQDFACNVLVDFYVFLGA